MAAELGYKSDSRVEDWSVRYQWRERLLMWSADPEDFEERFLAASGRHLWPAPVIGRQGRPESPEALQAWLVYLAQGESRSYRLTAAQLGKRLSLIARWAKRHHWQDRIRAAERKAAQPDEEPWYGPPLEDPLFEEHQLTNAKDLLRAMAAPVLSRAEHKRLLRETLESALQPWLSEPQDGPRSEPALPPPLRARHLLEVCDTEELSLARTVREAVKFLRPIVAISETDEPLWHEEVNEHLEALEHLTRSDRAPLTNRDDEAARGLLSRLAILGSQLEDSILQQPQALADMVRLLNPFFTALSQQHTARNAGRPHLQQLVSSMSLLPGTIANHQEGREAARQ